MSDGAATPLFQRNGVRVGLVGLVGLYLFLVCAAYMGRDPIQPGVSVAVLGPEVVEPGGWFPLRAVAYKQRRGHHNSKIVAATIIGPRGERRVELTDTIEGIPSVAHVGPAPKDKGPFKVRLTVKSAEGQRDVDVPLVVYDPRVVEPPLPMELADKIPLKGQLFIEILTEGAGLDMAKDNRAWLRVTDRAGAPVTGALVAWEASGTDPVEGLVETDAAGLAPITLEPRALSSRFKLVAKKGEMTGTLEEMHRPLGRGVLLEVRRMLQAHGEPAIPVTIRRSNPNTTVYCDLYRGDAWVRTWHLVAEDGGERRTDVELDLPVADTYKLQCYTHYSTPGEGGDATWLFRSDEPRVRAMAKLLRESPGDGRTRAYRKAVPVIDDAAQNALLASYRTQLVAITDPALAMSTRKTDLDQSKSANATVRVRFFLLIGASFGLIILWAMYIATQSAIESRVRLAEAIEELAELKVEVKPPTRLVRARKTIAVAFMLAVLILNIVALLALFRYL